MENSVDDHPVKFFFEIGSEFNGVFTYTVHTDEKISGQYLSFAIVEGYDVGEIIMLELLHVDIENVIVGTENDIDVPYLPDFTAGNHLEPAVVCEFILVGKLDVFAKITDHNLEISTNLQLLIQKI